MLGYIEKNDSEDAEGSNMIEGVISEILNPADEFSPIPFWFLNDRLEMETLKGQLENFCSKGVTAVVLHPRIGIPAEMEYLSKSYFDIMEYIVQTADSLGMKIVLYDEGMYPSGSAHGMVAASDASFLPIGITLSDRPDDGQLVAAIEDGTYLVCKKTGGTIRGIHYGEG